MTDTEFHDDQPALDLRNTHLDFDQLEIPDLTTAELWGESRRQLATWHLYGYPERTNG
jgi:hypothetical protein